VGRNYDIGLLRAIALDSGASPSRRLKALDRLASGDNVYQTARINEAEYRPTPARARGFIVKALRRLLKSPDLMACHASAIRERLLCIRGIESKHFFRLHEGASKTTVTSEQSPVASEIDEFLAKHGVYKAASQEPKEGQ
jgi:hypothetical protein